MMLLTDGSHNNGCLIARLCKRLITVPPMGESFVKAEYVFRLTQLYKESECIGLYRHSNGFYLLNPRWAISNCLL